jgi:antitoxin PrlF
MASTLGPRTPTGTKRGKPVRPARPRKPSRSTSAEEAQQILGASQLRSKISKKAQTTLPSGVRKALGVQNGDELVYLIEGNRAIVTKLTHDDTPDPVLLAFLSHLEADIMARPQAMSTMPPALFARMAALADGVAVDYDAPIEGTVAL